MASNTQSHVFFVSIPNSPYRSTKNKPETSNTRGWLLTWYHVKGVKARETIMKMMSQDDFSPIKAVEEVYCLSMAAVVDDEAFRHHVQCVIDSIHFLACNTPGDEQSKLIDFIIRLQQHTVLHPETGYAVETSGRVYWTGLPLVWLDVPRPPPPGITREKTTCYRAFLAQLDEGGHKPTHGIWRILEEGWSIMYDLECDRDNEIDKHLVRDACMLVIYGPNRVWGLAQARTQLGRSGWHFKPESWMQLRRIFERIVGIPLALIGEDIRGLIWRALSAMDRVEEEEAGDDYPMIYKTWNAAFGQFELSDFEIGSLRGWVWDEVQALKRARSGQEALPANESSCLFRAARTLDDAFRA